MLAERVLSYEQGIVKPTFLTAAVAVSLWACAPAAPHQHAAVATASPTSSAAATPTTTPEDLAEEARELATRYIVVDGHVDLPHRLEESRNADGTVSEDVTTRTPKGDFDYPRAKDGGLDAPFMSIYIPAKYQKEGGAKALADRLIDTVEAIAHGAPDKFAVARSPQEVRDNFAAGRISFPMGIENGAAIESDLANLAHFHRRGVRYITLTHSKDNAICDSSYDDSHTHKGLSDFGARVVPEMNRLGIMIDVSHISDDAFEDVMKLSVVPVIASHSSCRHYTPGFERNMSDAMIEKLAAKGGVIMINYGSSFINDAARLERKKSWDALDAFKKTNSIEGDDPRAKAFRDRYEREHKLPFATVEQVADHIDHVRKLVGIDHVGLGSDFDGVGDSLPTDLKDASQLPNLLRVLLERGYSEADIEKVCSGNVLRVWQAVEDHAAKQ